MKARNMPKARISTYEKVVFSFIALFVAFLLFLAARGLLGYGSHITTSRVLEGTPETVWSYLTDPMKRPDWEWQIRSIIPSSEEKQQEGSRNFLVMQRNHRSWDGGEVFEVYQEAQLLKINRETDEDFLTLTYQLERVGGATRVTVTVDHLYQGLRDRMLAFFEDASIEEAFAGSLETLNYIMKEAKN